LGRYTNGAPTRACNYINWLDNAAYADWAGLRPITELEYEKACRGPLYPVTNECAWGSITTIWLTGFAGGSDGSGTETAIPSSANCNIANSRLGPVRVGVYATTNSSRQDAGASYWGIMEMSGNLQERTVAVGNTTGREFTGVHGDGKLNDAGDADVSVLLWPQGAGTGERGGSWDGSPLWYTRVSDRRLVLNPYSRKGWIGGRAGRSVPGMNP